MSEANNIQYLINDFKKSVPNHSRAELVILNTMLNNLSPDDLEILANEARKIDQKNIETREVTGRKKNIIQRVRYFVFGTH